MNTIRATIVASIMLFFFGSCQRASNDIPPSGFRLSRQDIVAEPDLRVAQLTINSQDAGTIFVDAEGSHQSAAFAELRRAQATITLVASRVAPPQQQRWSYVQSLIRIQVPSVTTGGPALDTLAQSVPLSSFFTVTASNGDYPFGRPIEIATLRGKPVTLTVKRTTPEE